MGALSSPVHHDPRQRWHFCKSATCTLPLQEHDDLVQHLEKRPDGQWRSGTLWSFKNEDKVCMALSQTTCQAWLCLA